MGLEPTTFCMARSTREAPPSDRNRQPAWLRARNGGHGDSKRQQPTPKGSLKKGRPSTDVRLRGPSENVLHDGGGVAPVARIGAEREAGVSVSDEIGERRRRELEVGRQERGERVQPR